MEDPAFAFAVCDNERESSPESQHAPTIQTLGIDQMSREERLSLVEEIWDTIAAESLPHLLTEAQRLELRSSVAEDDANPDEVVPWEQVKAQTLARLKP